jgi:hypothetical protein
MATVEGCGLVRRAPVRSRSGSPPARSLPAPCPPPSQERVVPHGVFEGASPGASPGSQMAATVSETSLAQTASRERTREGSLATCESIPEECIRTRLSPTRSSAPLGAAHAPSSGESDPGESSGSVESPRVPVRCSSAAPRPDRSERISRSPSLVAWSSSTLGARAEASASQPRESSSRGSGTAAGARSARAAAAPP